MHNSALLCGVVAEKPAFSHEIAGSRLYRAALDVVRLSGTVDRVPLLLPERLAGLLAGEVLVRGQLRGYSRQEEGRRRLRLMVLVREAEEARPGPNNQVELEGSLLRPPNYRLTPMGREIADLLLRVERDRGGEDCIPAIVWGGCARYARSLRKGEKLRVRGRIQSRPYMKLQQDGSVREMTALELSICRLEREE